MPAIHGFLVTTLLLAGVVVSAGQGEWLGALICLVLGAVCAGLTRFTWVAITDPQ